MDNNVIIDTDPGVDDALAILYANNARFNVRAITTVYGNSSLDNVTRNVGYLLKAIGSNWPIYKGEGSPLSGKPYLAESHGEVGLGNIIPGNDEIKPFEKITALDYFEKISGSSHKYTFLCLGPLTTITHALTIQPKLSAKIEQIILMGGAFNQIGNVTKHAEFNIYNDPVALRELIIIAQINSIEIVIIPVDVCRKVTLTMNELNDLHGNTQIKNIKNIVEPFINYYTSDSTYGNFDGAVMYDVLVPLFLSNEALFTSVNADIIVDTDPNEYYGRTTFIPNSNSSIRVCTDINARSAKKIIIDILKL